MYIINIQGVYGKEKMLRTCVPEGSLCVLSSTDSAAYLGLAERREGAVSLGRARTQLWGGSEHMSCHEEGGSHQGVVGHDLGKVEQRT